MKDKTQYYFINSETVDLLISHKQESDKYRVDELVVAQILYQFCKKMWNCECFIGFPIKNSKVNSIDQVGFSGIEDIKKVINEKIEQDHDVDILIVKNRSIDAFDMAGIGFQIKRFDRHQSDKTTDGIIKFIQDLKYGKTDTGLVILLATGMGTEFSKVRSSIDFEKFPFSGLYFTGLYGDTMKFIEVWPNYGKEEIKVNWSKPPIE